MIDAVVIGGGPAGAALAAHLCRAGRTATVIESRSFPRAKVCGEFISPAATADLESLLPPARLLRLGARRVRRFTLEVGARSLSRPLAAPAWALGRSVLDHELLSVAAEEGAQIRQPALVRDVLYNDDRVEVQLNDGSSISARIVVHADGAGRFDPAGPVRRDPRLVGLKCRLNLPGGIDGVLLRSCRGAYLGLLTVEEGLTTCALVARTPLLAPFARNLDGFAASLWPGFEACRRVGPWLSSSVARSPYVPPGHVRSYRLGNAAGAVDPVGGEGIGLALWSARQLSRLLGAAEANVESLRAVQRTFAGLYRRRLRVRRPGCRAVAAGLMRPSLVRLAWPLLASGRRGLSPWYVLTGKPFGPRAQPVGHLDSP